MIFCIIRNTNKPTIKKPVEFDHDEDFDNKRDKDTVGVYYLWT